MLTHMDDNNPTGLLVDVAGALLNCSYGHYNGKDVYQMWSVVKKSMHVQCKHCVALHLISQVSSSHFIFCILKMSKYR